MQIKTTIIENGKVEEISVSSDLIDALYEIIKQTYLEAEEICIKNPTNADSIKLGDFLTFILAYPKDVKTPIVKVTNEKINSNNTYCDRFQGKTIICFSGGVDSTGALLKSIDEGNTPVAMWCDYGQPYRKMEREAVEKISNKLNIPLLEVTLDISDLIAIGGERFGHVFPARNLLITAIGLCFKPDKMQLAGLCDELIVPDKSLRMYDEFGKLFGTKLYSSFVTMSKADVLCLWQKNWDKYLSADETISCYGEDGDCQNCSSCAKREIAFVASGYHKYVPEVFSNQHELIENHWFSRIDSFGFERRTDILVALESVYCDITPKLQELVLKYSEKYALEVAKRKEQLKEEGGTLEE